MFNRYLFTLICTIAMATSFSCSTSQNKVEKKEMDRTGSEQFNLMVLYPGHFHASLVQKSMYDQVDSVVYVYAPEGPELEAYLSSIESYNTRTSEPTNWHLQVYRGPDFFEKMLEERKGNIMVIAGNNQKKTEFIKATVDAGIHVLADKPMAIDSEGFELLKEAFASADKNNVLLYDIMTERYEITSILQKEFSMIPEIFGTLEKGTLENPAVTKESIHHFFKYVSSKPLIRPAWFFDVTQQGSGIVDVTTHLVDLVQWECFPEKIINYEKDIEIINARTWATELTPSQFEKVTQLKFYPDYLKKDLVSNDILSVHSNGEINYKINDVHAKVSVVWNYEAPEGSGDTHYSIMRGSKSNIIIRQGMHENFKPELYIEPVQTDDLISFEKDLERDLAKIQQKYPGVTVEKEAEEKVWKVMIPENYRTGHEAHFREVTEKYLQYLEQGKLPEWEVPNMISKYYVTTKALEMAGE